MNSSVPTVASNQLSEKTYLLAHQNVCITDIDFVAKRINGFVELHFLPLKLKVSRIKLNTKQCQIKRLLAKGCHDYQICAFTYNDPLLEIVPNEPPSESGELIAPERTLKKFNSKHQDAVYSVEYDCGNGEIVITLPDEVQKDVSDGSTFKVFIEYMIENPQGGLHFVLPEDDNASQPGLVDLAATLQSDAAANSTPNASVPNAPHTETPPSTSANESFNKEQSTASPQLNGTGIASPAQGNITPRPAQDQQNSKAATNASPANDDETQADKEEEEEEENTQDRAQPQSKALPVTKGSKYAHLFSYKQHNSSRLWFPCVDSYGHPCTWYLEFTVDSHLTVISCGDLVSTYSSSDRRKKTYTFELNVPTSAPNIGFVVGQFDVWIDPSSAGSNCQIKNYFLPGLNKLVRASCNFSNECSEFYEEFLTFKYPYTNYKQVFVDQAYEPYQSYATLSICCTNLLHSKHIIDQTFETRSVLSEAMASQYFGCFIEKLSWSAAWLTRGISSYLAAQYRRKTFGNNEYRYQVQEMMQKLIQYEQKFGGVVLDETTSDHVVNKSRNVFHFSTQSPHTISPFFNEAHKLKSFLVMRMLEDRIGKLLLVQVFNKILSLASTASQQPASTNMWGNMLISTITFEKAVFTVTGKDKEIASFLEHWIFQGGHAKFNASFIFDRKRNVVELHIRQSDTSCVGIRPYFGPITVTVQELDGTFPQKLNIEENKTTPFVITCHSKSRRNKKKKIPLCTGEEVDMNLSMMDNHDSPVLWIRIDPDIQILREVIFEQPDYQWQYQLKYERDVTAQLDSLNVLISHPTIATRKTLTDIIEDEKCFYRVRCKAALNLTKVANDMAITTTSGGWQAPTSMINIYKRLFGSHSCPHIIRLNNFSPTNLQSYFLQKTIPKALAGLRVPPHRICPPEVLKFLLDLFKYNDNSKNNFSDNYYRASLIEALAETVTPVVVSLFNSAMQNTTFDQLPSETKLVAEEITRCLNLEKILPCYKNVVTVACLKAIQQLQKMGHLPSNSHLFRTYTDKNLFIDVRCAAIVELVDIIKTEQNHEDLEFLLDLIDSDKVPAFKFFVLSELHRNPPTTIHTFPNYSMIREKLWHLINSRFAHDSKLRCASADVFHKLFGKSDKSSLSSSFAGDINYKPKKKKKKKDKDRDKDKEKRRLKKKEKLRLSMESQQQFAQFPLQSQPLTSAHLPSQPLLSDTLPSDQFMTE